MDRTTHFYKLEITALHPDLGLSSLVSQTNPFMPNLILLWKEYGLSILEGVQDCPFNKPSFKRDFWFINLWGVPYTGDPNKHGFQY